MKQFILFTCLIFSTSIILANSSSQNIKAEISKIGTETPKLSDRPEKENLNGFLPDKIYIKTLTQTFCKGFEFCLVDGRIYSKTEEDDNWELFLGKGLPFSKSKKFQSPKRIVEIAADDDCLFAFDSD